MTDRDAIARSFSEHRFDETAEHLADNVVWMLPGGPPIEGREAVIAACKKTAADLAGTTTTFERLISTGDGDVVAVDTVASYEEPGETSRVSSADIYEFDEGSVAKITSYTVEL